MILQENNCVSLKSIDALIWDWNGTLLDDVEINLKVINKMLVNRNLDVLTLSQYKDLFCFPVQSFHRKIGFDFEKESIEEISQEYHTVYQEYENEKKLNPDALSILNMVCEAGRKQYILSASQKNTLQKETDYFGITDKFDGIYGANDICAVGKIQIGKQLMQENGLVPDKVLIIGDTLHDAEVAKALNIRHILYSGGHNSYRLLAEKSDVIVDLKEIIDIKSTRNEQ